MSGDYGSELTYAKTVVVPSDECSDFFLVPFGEKVTVTSKTEHVETLTINCDYDDIVNRFNYDDIKFSN